MGRLVLGVLAVVVVAVLAFSVTGYFVVGLLPLALVAVITTKRTPTPSAEPSLVALPLMVLALGREGEWLDAGAVGVGEERAAPTGPE